MRRQVVGRLKNPLAFPGQHEIEEEHRRLRVRRVFGVGASNRDITPSASVKGVALLRSAERQKILVEGAKKEGKLMFYTALIVDQVVRPVKAAFEKRVSVYPT